jgi:hypothetical protein
MRTRGHAECFGAGFGKHLVGQFGQNSVTGQPMITSAVLRTLRFFSQPLVIAVLLVLFLVGWLARGQKLFEDTSASRLAEVNKKELIERDPEAAAVFAKIRDDQEQNALLIAAYSASKD